MEILGYPDHGCLKVFFFKRQLDCFVLEEEENISHSRSIISSDGMREGKIGIDS